MVVSCLSDIYISRGDDAAIACEVLSESGEAEPLQEGDRLTLFISDEKTGKVEAQLDAEAGTFTLDRTLTERLSGEYVYSVVLSYADGTRTTVIGKSPNKTPRLTVLE